jgi:predicted FMN-binding regulatory protein PaiB
LFIPEKAKLVKISVKENKMQFQKIYSQPDRAEIDALIQTQPYCYLMTCTQDCQQQVGMFNHYFNGEEFVLHLNVNDEQVKAMLAYKRAMIILHKFYSLIPSHWVDPEDGAAATAYYKYAEFACDIEIQSDYADKKTALQELMDKYQPEGGYAPLDSSSHNYQKSFAAITIVKLRPYKARTKWKFGQNRPKETRQRIVNALTTRAHQLDVETASEITKLMEVAVQDY